MSPRNTRCLVASIACLLFGTACTKSIPEGRFACSDGRACPASWYCHSDQLCYASPELDAAIDSGADGAMDARVCIEDDPPDDGFEDANCDGIDGVAASMIFVSAIGGDDSTGDGSSNFPFATISRGIVAAIATSKRGIAVMAGTYEERVVVRDGISIYGGYGTGWSRDASNVVTITQPITPITDGEGNRIECVYAANIHTQTVLDRLTILAGSTVDAPTMPSINVYGIRIVDSIPTSSTGLVLRNLSVTAGRASDGVEGAPGDTGEPAVVGTSGESGGDGGTAVCGGVPIPSTSGGRGGRGAFDGTFGEVSEVATAGQPGAVASIACGVGLPGANYPSVAIDMFVRDDAHDGSVGLAPHPSCGLDVSTTRGSAATALSTVGRATNGHFVAERGGDGGRGPHGAGGSGGGGGGGVELTSGGILMGGEGGGGTSGSCGGYEGRGGTGGGSSIGLFVIRSANVRIEASVLTSGQAGKGGAGGPGGAAGDGYQVTASGGGAHTAAATGGPGGPGRSGGPGGGGGGGAGGSSIALLVCDSTGVDASPGIAGAAGSGGIGANSSPDGPPGYSLPYAPTCTLSVTP